MSSKKPSVSDKWLTGCILALLAGLFTLAATACGELPLEPDVTIGKMKVYNTTDKPLPVEIYKYLSLTEEIYERWCPVQDYTLTLYDDTIEPDYTHRKHDILLPSLNTQTVPGTIYKNFLGETFIDVPNWPLRETRLLHFISHNSMDCIGTPDAAHALAFLIFELDAFIWLDQIVYDITQEDD